MASPNSFTLLSRVSATLVASSDIAYINTIFKSSTLYNRCIIEVTRQFEIRCKEGNTKKKNWIQNFTLKSSGKITGVTILFGQSFDFSKEVAKRLYESFPIFIKLSILKNHTLTYKFLLRKKMHRTFIDIETEYA